MKREFLKELGLTDEQIDKVMAENGRDIEKHKTTAETHKAENENLKSQLEEANKQIGDFKDMDIEGIKKAADEYKQKFEEAQKKAKADMEKLQFDHALENALNKAGAKNVKAAKALLDIGSLKSSKNIDSDIEVAITKLKETDDYLFGETEPTGTGGSLGAGEKKKQPTGNNSKTDFVEAIREVQAKRE